MYIWMYDGIQWLDNGKYTGMHNEIDPPVIKHCNEEWPFISKFVTKTSIHRGLSISMLNYERAYWDA